MRSIIIKEGNEWWASWIKGGIKSNLSHEHYYVEWPIHNSWVWLMLLEFAREEKKEVKTEKEGNGKKLVDLLRMHIKINTNGQLD